MKILQTVIKFNLSTQVMVYFNASRKLISTKFIDLLAKSKIIITIGVQTTNIKALSLAKRSTQLKILETNLFRMDRAGVLYRLEFIEGLPGDSLSSIKKTIAWVFQFKARLLFFTDF